MARWGFDLYTMINGPAIIMMLAALFKAFDYYRRTIPSSSPILRRTSSYFSHKKQKDLIVAVIFFLGSIYVLITLSLVHHIITVMKGK